MDIRAERDALRLHIDVTVANAECRSHRNKSFDKPFAEKDAAKHKAYKEATRSSLTALHVGGRPLHISAHNSPRKNEGKDKQNSSHERERGELY